MSLGDKCNFEIMKKIQLHDKTFKLFIPYEEIMSAIDNVADEINKDFKDSKDIPILLCVLNGSIMFTAELMKRLEFQCELVAIKLSSYVGTTSTGEVTTMLGLSSSLEGRRVIVLEDIVDSGHTIIELDNILKKEGAADVKMCTMLLKPDAYKKERKLDYVGLEIPNDFIVGFGLDYNELGRNLRDIYTLDI